MIVRQIQVAMLLAAALAAAGCVGGEDGSPARPGAAEPAVAPAPSTAAAGTSVAVGERPQGIVYDATTDTLAVAVHDPFRLLLLDPTTLQVRRSVPLPGKARHLQLAGPGGPVLVPDESANQLVEVALPAGTIRVTAVQRHPHDATGLSDGGIVVGNEFSGSISLLRAGAVDRSVSDLEQPGGVVTDGRVVAVVDVGAFTLSTYDVDTLQRLGRIPAGRGPTHGVVTTGGRVVISDTRGGRVLVDALSPLRQVGRLGLPGSPYGLASDPTSGTVWVTLTARNELVGLDLSGDTPRVMERYPTVRQPDTVAVGPGARTLWVTGTADGVVQRIAR